MRRLDEEKALEKLIVGLQITFLGMTIVFLILVLISLALNLMKVFFYESGSSEKAKPKPTPAPTPSRAPSRAPATAPESGHLIAVLTAAIMATGEVRAPFRTLSIRPVGEKESAWKTNARALLMRRTAPARPRKKSLPR